MRDGFLPFSQPLLGEEEIQGVLECLRSGWLTTGSKTRQFEAEFASYVGARHAVAVSSCTAAMHLALEAAGIGPGDEVITSPMTFTATAAVVEQLGGRPRFVDCRADDLNLDPSRIESGVTPRTRAILPVHFGGQACDMDPILEIASRRGLSVVEDAAHALPTRYRGRRVGAIGDATCFSFYPTKPVTTGEGGMVTTQDDRRADRMRLMSLHGMSRDSWKRYAEDGSWTYEVIAPGFKYNLPDLAAAIGIPQLRRCGESRERRAQIARRYAQAFADLEEVRPLAVRAAEDHSWHLYVIRLEPDALRIDRDEFVRQMLARKIGVSVHFIPLHVQPYYRDRYGHAPGDFPAAWEAFRRIVSLPIYARMSDRDTEDVVAAVLDVVERYRR